MSQKRSYWIYQLIGWSFYHFSELIGLFTLFSFNLDGFTLMIGNAVVNIIMGITLTHVFRLIYKEYEWIKLPVGQMIIRSGAMVLLITFIMAAVNIPLDGQLINTEKMNWALRDIGYLVTLGKPVLIWVLIYVFYSYTNERKNDAIVRIKLQSSIKETEAKVLRAQMNPHFMFNALNSIRALILEDPSRAQKGITQLSNILRSSLVADRRTTVTLKEELKTIADYLALEKVRYEERLQVKWDIDERTLNLLVPPMMLQTLVENAIKHGVQKALRWGFVEIRTSLDAKNLIIRVRNTGELLRKINNHEAGGFGLINTQQRLKLLYGDDARFEIKQEDSITVCAEILLPLGKLSIKPKVEAANARNSEIIG
jgi:two-component system LytT family sensor kinase